MINYSSTIILNSTNTLCLKCVNDFLENNQFLAFNWTLIIIAWFIAEFLRGFLPYIQGKITNPYYLRLIEHINGICNILLGTLSFIALIIVLMT